ARATAVATAEPTAFSRTPGGIGAYLAIRARGPAATGNAIHALGAGDALQIVPAARGGMSAAARPEVGGALRVAGALSGPRAGQEGRALVDAAAGVALRRARRPDGAHPRDRSPRYRALPVARRAREPARARGCAGERRGRARGARAHLLRGRGDRDGEGLRRV